MGTYRHLVYISRYIYSIYRCLVHASCLVTNLRLNPVFQVARHAIQSLVAFQKKKGLAGNIEHLKSQEMPTSYKADPRNFTTRNSSRVGPQFSLPFPSTSRVNAEGPPLFFLHFPRRTIKPNLLIARSRRAGSFFSVISRTSATVLPRAEGFKTRPRTWTNKVGHSPEPSRQHLTFFKLLHQQNYLYIYEYILI